VSDNKRAVAAAPTSNDLAKQRTSLADDRTRLALTRTVIALDRTLMAWIRTAMSLIGFGFTIYKFFQYLRESQPQPHRLLTPRVVGLASIGLGIGSLIYAAFDYRQSVRELRVKFPHYEIHERSLTLAVAAAIGGLGAVGLILVFLRQ
jgi:putative membrane protein